MNKKKKKSKDLNISEFIDENSDLAESFDKKLNFKKKNLILEDSYVSDEFFENLKNTKYSDTLEEDSVSVSLNKKKLIKEEKLSKSSKSDDSDILVSKSEKLNLSESLNKKSKNLKLSDESDYTEDLNDLL